MKAYSTLWALTLCLLSSDALLAMRRGPSLLHHTLRTRQYFLIRQLRHQRQTRALSALTHYDWLKNQCYQQLKKEPTGQETRDLINKQSPETKQALLEAAVQDHHVDPGSLVTLLEAGADINKPDGNGQTPLHKLANSTKTDESDLRAQVLLAYIAHYKPNFEAKDRQGKRPCDLADEGLEDWFEEHEPICWSRLREMYRSY